MAGVFKRRVAFFVCNFFFGNRDRPREGEWDTGIPRVSVDPIHGHFVPKSILLLTAQMAF
jgi:hypothetical protein